MIRKRLPGRNPARRILPCLALATASLLTTANSASAEMPESYRKLWSDPAVAKRIDEGIERNRKGDAAIAIVDSAGKPVADASLNIRQKTHDFLFGCNILWLGQLGDLNEAYEQEFARLFNLATTTFCLGAIEPAKGQLRFAEGSEEVFRRPPPDRVVAFAKKYGIKLKGQPLLADSWHPEWAKDMTPDEARALYKDYFQRVADRYGRDFAIFDVVNEAFFCKGRNERRKRIFPLYTEDLAYAGWAFETAQPLFSKKCLLTINEGTGVNTTECDRYFNFVKGILDSGRRLDGIGFQFHIFGLKSHLAGQSFTPPQLLETYDKFGQLNRPLIITEITIPSTVAKGAEGEAIQAEAVANFYRLWFSVPKMAGIIYWNFCDGVAWKTEGNAKAGLVDELMREKPAYQALYQLIHRQWKTNLSATTDAQGKASFRGFYGKYSVQVTGGGRSQSFEIDLSKESTGAHTLTLKP